MGESTSRKEFYPCGTTGTGKCEQSCDDGFRNARGRWEHIGKLGRQPKDGPRGPGAIRIKNAVPSMFLHEYTVMISFCMKHRSSSEQTVVIDLCSGWQSLRPVCEELGLQYIAV